MHYRLLNKLRYAGSYKRSGILEQIIMRMKITSLLVCVACIQVYATAFGQRITLSKKHASMVEMFREIRKQGEVDFIYKIIQLAQAKPVDIEVKDMPLDQVLQLVFKDQPIDYMIDNKTIIIRDKKIKTTLYNQEYIKVFGTVSDSSGVLKGVNITVKGFTNTGTATDGDGKYTLEVPIGSVIQFHILGYKDQEYTVAKEGKLNVLMKPEEAQLDEIVVVGYGTQKKINLTGAIVSVKTDQLTKIPAANLSNVLAGRIPGATVVGTSGLAGASASVRIRGSFGEPLYVINGVIKTKADFDALDVNEVESINVLKDAASASIYGSRAGNGVIVITTKKGLLQKPTFDYQGSYSFSNPTRPLQDYTATQEIEYDNQVAATMGQPKPYGQDIYDYFKDKNYRINDYIWQTPTVQQHNLGVRGGTEKILYNLSLGYHSEDGSYKNLNYDRYNFRSNVVANISKRIKLSADLSGNQRSYNRWYWPYDGAENANVSDFYRATFNWSRLYPFYVDEQGNPTTNTDAFPVTPGAWHPVELVLHGGTRDIDYRNFDGILRFDVDLSDILDGLSTSFQGQYNGMDKSSKALVLFNKAYLFQSASATNKFIPGPIDPTKINLHNLSANYPNITEEGNFYHSYQYNWYLQYDKTFGKHEISALGVYEQMKDNGRYMNGRADDLLSSQIDQIYNTSTDATKRWFDGYESETARASWIGRVHYGYDQKYMVEFSFRYDGNYKFAPGQRWGFFPSVSAAWRLSEEPFLKDVHWLSNLKLRGSYGTTGNDNPSGNESESLPGFLWSQMYEKSTGYVFGTAYSDGLAPGALPNPYITWATSKMYDAGLEYGFFNNKLYGEVDVFKRTLSDILGTRLGSTPSTLGATLPSVNYAKESWKGFEVSLNYDTQIGNVKLSSYGSLGYAIDKWDTYDEAAAYTDGTYKDNWRSVIGKPRDRVYGLISKGIIRTQQELDNLPEGFTQFGRTPKLGYLLFEDIRGQNFTEGPDGKIDDNDYTYLSNNGSPRINYGVGFRLSYKGFSFNAHFQGVGSYDRMVSTMNGGGVFQSDRPYFSLWSSNYWTPENPNAKYPRVSGEWMQPDIGGGASTFWLRNGAYLRLKNVDLGYDLPGHWFKRIGIERVQLFVNATNLFSISGMPEYDPEQNTLDSYPLMRTYTGGLNITF
ncbi:TonB-linked outer membrane protein, SusC/RagA family [bacterium A37T11]|nr:TonB-linked outer membrane protein, SusC/RagA family [bacterium A37T11]